MQANSHSHQKSSLFITIAIGLVVLVFGIVIKSTLAGTTIPVSEQVVKAESDRAPVLQEAVDQIPLQSPDQVINQEANKPSSLEENSLTTQVKSQTLNGIEFTISNYRRVANHFFIDVCYDLPGSGIWDINGATLLYGSIKTSHYAFREISLQVATEAAQIGRRCANLDFSEIFTSEESKTFTLAIEWIGLTEPPEGQECKEYLARGEAALAQHGITLQCDSGPGYFGMAIANKPDQMTQAEAEHLLAKIVYGRIDGPWTFNSTVEK